jgi:hypothetical protein
LKHLNYSIVCDQRFEEKIANEQLEITIKNLAISYDWIEDKIKENEKKYKFQPHTIVEFRKFLFQYVK